MLCVERKCLDSMLVGHNASWHAYTGGCCVLRTLQGGSSLLSFPRCWCRHAMLEYVADVRILLYTCDDIVFRRPPGTKFTYDSDTFIAYLSYLLDQVAGAAHNSSARQFADEFFARPLGLPDLYAFQNGDPENIGDKPYEKVPVLRRVHAGPPFRTPSRSLHCCAVGQESTIPLTQRQPMPATKVVDKNSLRMAPFFF